MSTSTGSHDDDGRKNRPSLPRERWCKMSDAAIAQRKWDALVEDGLLSAPNAIPVDSGTLLIVDPCRIDVDTLRALLGPNKHGVTLAATVPAPGGDGFFEIVEFGDTIGVAQPGVWDEHLGSGGDTA